MSASDQIIVVSSVDRSVRATEATGLIARWFRDHRTPVITMKMVQTGGTRSEAILTHRRLADMEMCEEDAIGLTSPYTFSSDGDPYLAARHNGSVIDPDLIVNNARELSRDNTTVLIEGAGGLFVPLTESTLVIDICESQGWPVVLVSSPAGGVLNSTLAALDGLRCRGLHVMGIVFSLQGSSSIDPQVVTDTRNLIGEHIAALGCRDRICDIPDVSCTPSYCVDFSPLFT